jgi:hypothetical protein
VKQNSVERKHKTISTRHPNTQHTDTSEKAVVPSSSDQEYEPNKNTCVWDRHDPHTETHHRTAQQQKTNCQKEIHRTAQTTTQRTVKNNLFLLALSLRLICILNGTFKIGQLPSQNKTNSKHVHIQNKKKAESTKQSHTHSRQNEISLRNIIWIGTFI